ncbi:hypothetical protein AWV80_30630 [Cupriavidus sp. UYMU48A]|nr:hypothetical protein AWV80_30630 [Cupriavidus sp. UYMU48A]
MKGFLFARTSVRNVEIRGSAAGLAFCRDCAIRADPETNAMHNNRAVDAPCRSYRQNRWSLYIAHALVIGHKVV